MITNALAGVAVHDFDSGVDWYARLLGRDPDTRPMEGLAEWRFAGGGWLQVFADTERAGSSSVTLVESDLDRRLWTMDIPVSDITRSDFIDTARFRDPDGNLIVF